MNKKSDIAENIFRCRSPPSLERISLTRVAISLWQQHDILKEIVHALDPHVLFMNTDSVMYLHRIWRPKIEEKVLRKIHCLLIPNCWIEVLEGTIKAIGGQILAFLTTSDQLDFPFHEKIKLYWDNICWTMRGTVNNLKTASLLVDDEDIRTKEKYILACNNCLDSKIRDIWGELPDHIINDFIDEHKFRLVLFWTYYIKDEQYKFSEILCKGIVFGFSYKKYILRWAMEHKNEVAAQYIWENLSDSEMKERVVDFAELALRWPALVDTTFYLFSKMNHDQIEEICVKKGYILLVSLLHNWRWHDFLVPIALYILKFIKKMTVWDALEIIMFCWEEDILQRDENLSIVNEFILGFANDIKLNFKDICEKMLVPLFYMEDAETLKLLIRTGTLYDRKQLLYDDFGMTRCAQFIINRKHSLVAIFIKEMLTTPEEIHQFKRRFFGIKSCKICFCLVLREKYDELDEFLMTFCSEVDVATFKYKMLFGKEDRMIKTILKNVNYRESDPLIMIDKFLSWCFDGDEMKLVNYTSEKDILSGMRGLFLRLVLELTREREWQQVERYLKWAIFTEYKICKYKVKKIRCDLLSCFKSRRERNLLVIID